MARVSLLWLLIVTACANASSRNVPPGDDDPVDAAVADAPDIGPDPRTPPLTMRVHAIPLADDDGGRPADITPAQVTQWVAAANRTFRAAGITFLFDAAVDFEGRRNNSVLNSIGAGPSAAQRNAANAIAAEHPGELVVFFRHGPDAIAIGTGVSATRNINFVAMPGFASATLCNHADLQSFAREAGHYLGLLDSFAREDADDAAALAAFTAAGNSLNAFEGDGVADNGVDPFITTHQCDDTAEVSIGGQQLPLGRTDIMSKYDNKTKTLTPQQVDIVRQALAMRRGFDLGVVLDVVTLRFEAEDLVAATTGAPLPSAQSMSPFDGKWSNGNQAFWNPQVGEEIEITLPAAAGPGPKRLFGVFTVAPDFARLEVSVNDSVVLPDLDLYGGQVQHRGPIDLGVWAGATARIKLRVIGKNDRSVTTKAGIDAFLVGPP
jgi:hypothetical protein